MFDLLDILYIIPYERVIETLKMDGLLTDDVHLKLIDIRKFIDKYVILSTGNCFGNEMTENTGKYINGDLVCEVYADDEIDYIDALKPISEYEETRVGIYEGLIVLHSQAPAVWKLLGGDSIINLVASKFSVSDDVVRSFLSCYEINIRIIGPSEELFKYYINF